MTKELPLFVNVYWCKKDEELKCYDPDHITTGLGDIRYVRADSLLDALVKSGEYDVTIHVRENNE